jgi:hypothetical protein
MLGNVSRKKAQELLVYKIVFFGKSCTRKHEISVREDCVPLNG